MADCPIPPPIHPAGPSDARRERSGRSRRRDRIAAGCGALLVGGVCLGATMDDGDSDNSGSAAADAEDREVFTKTETRTVIREPDRGAEAERSSAERPPSRTPRTTQATTPSSTATSTPPRSSSDEPTTVVETSATPAEPISDTPTSTSATTTDTPDKDDRGGSPPLDLDVPPVHAKGP